jgi:hypothetical protein
MKYTVGMSAGVMIYIPSFIKIGSGIQKLIGGYTDSQTDGSDFKIGRSDGLRCHGIHTGFHKDWFRHSKVDRGIHRLTD